MIFVPLLFLALSFVFITFIHHFYASYVFHNFYASWDENNGNTELTATTNSSEYTEVAQNADLKSTRDRSRSDLSISSTSSKDGKNHNTLENINVENDSNLSLVIFELYITDILSSGYLNFRNKW